MVNLIFDRTQSDVTRLKSLRAKVRNRTATVEEYEEWLTALKGAYNDADLNRVGEAINYLGGLLNTYGYFNTAKARTDWYVGEKPNPKQMAEYIENLNKLKRCFIVYASTPEIPNDMVNLVVKEANDIEKYLYDIDEILKKTLAMFRYSNTFYSSESEGLI
jgi:hypothetical protein